MFGASVTVAVMGRHHVLCQGRLVGAVAGTVPDLDVLIDHGDDLLNMVRHRAESHALFFLTLAAPLFGWLTHQLVDRKAPAGAPNPTARWSLAWLLALLTHVGIDAMTSYGTQFLQPFTDHAFAVGSVFIIDPLYTLPLLLGLWLSGLRARRGWTGETDLGAGWSDCCTCCEASVPGVRRRDASAALQQGVPNVPEAQLFVYATPFNTVLWRVLAVTPTHSSEGPACWTRGSASL